MFKRDRPKQIHVHTMHVLSITSSGVVQLGDVFGRVEPFEYGEAYAGYRGAASFLTTDQPAPVNTRLHFANQLDEDVLDLDILDEAIVVFTPNTYGGGTR